MTTLETLIENVKHSDEIAIRELYELTYRKSYITAKSIVKNEDKIYDVLQNSYIKVFNNISNLNNPNTVQSWISSIVSRTAYDQLKKDRDLSFSDIEDKFYSEDSFIEIEDESIEFKPNKAVEYEEDRQIVVNFINELPDLQRSALIMQVYDDMSISEIANIFECSEGTIKSRLNYAKSTLKSKIIEYRKKGNRLFAIPLIPYLKYIFAGLEESVEVDLSVLNRIAATTASSSASAVISEKIAKSTVKSAVKKTTIEKTGKIIASKVVKGVLSASLIAGGTFSLYKGYETYNKNKNPVQDSNTNIVVDQNNIENNNTISPEKYLEQVKDIFQNDYLNNKDIINAPKKILDLYNEAICYYPNNSVIEECKNYFIEEEAAYYRFYLIDHLEIHGNSYIYEDLNNDGRKELVVINRREDENILFYQQNNSQDILHELSSFKRDSFTLLTINSNKEINQVISYGHEYLSDISFLGFKDNQICIIRKQADLIVDDANNMNYLDFYAINDIYSYNSSNSNLLNQEKELVDIYEDANGILNEYQTNSASFREYTEITFNEIK